MPLGDRSSGVSRLIPINPVHGRSTRKYATSISLLHGHQFLFDYKKAILVADSFVQVRCLEITVFFSQQERILDKLVALKVV